MHGGAVTLARQFSNSLASPNKPRPDIILATDMLDLTTFRALIGTTIPIVLYMHENQLTYPLPAGPEAYTGPMRRQHGERDYHYAFINYASMLAADTVWFNSQYHFDSWFAALPRFLNRFPKYKELDTVATIHSRSRVLPPGIDTAGLQTGRKPSRRDNNPPLILWNQRWEYDKDPAAFFAALYALQTAGIDFRLALCGENFRRRPQGFDEALSRLAANLVHVGFAAEEQYRELLWAADITISTARHEFFGISILEAIACQTFPILPERLSYPEIIPEPFHARCLYTDQGELVQKLHWAVRQPAARSAIATDLARVVEAFSWTNVGPQYDRQLAKVLELKNC